ncbi:ribonuclease 3 [Diplogelasinospora grovesii]|uniref:Large ribosomal subunit protein mL44 n=1 Tax=Diplogelasinospora grovesii TaxID=303347 RepID=A0AAN6S8N3_9PEZI|nr:ribonuclease 3 [Diplogelasinospora grovesii]
MKRLRPSRWTGQLLLAGAGSGGRYGCASRRPAQHLVALSSSSSSSIRSQSSAAAAAAAQEEELAYDGTDHERFPPLDRIRPADTSYPSPAPERALQSAKLAALHARLSLSPKIPLQTLARTLVDASADGNPQFNNSNLAFVGQTLINYHVTEWLMVRYPRLPMSIIFSAMQGYAGDKPLHQVARSWGIEPAAAPGGEVDPGLLQFSAHKPGVSLVKFGYKRTEAEYLEKFKWRRGISSRIVFDDDFGQTVKATPGSEAEQSLEQQDGEEGEEGPVPVMQYGNADTRSAAETAHAHAVRATVGAVYAHCGREAVKNFIKSHILSRTLDVSKLFMFKSPTSELATLCAREDFEPPVARLLSETGRASRTPVYVVGIYSGKDKLAEAAGPNLDHARWAAAMNALKAWYLYSPGENVRVPSDMLSEGAKPWEPAHIDIGEVISR